MVLAQMLKRRTVFYIQIRQAIPTRLTARPAEGRYKKGIGVAEVRVAMTVAVDDVRHRRPGCQPRLLALANDFNCRVKFLAGHPRTVAPGRQLRALRQISRRVRG